MEHHPILDRLNSTIHDGEIDNIRHLINCLSLYEAERCPEVIESLLEKDAKINPLLRESALYLATCQGNDNVVRLLLEQGVSIHSKVGCPFSFIHIAVEKEYSNITELLLSNGADANARYTLEDHSEEGVALLHCAVEKGNEALVELLLRYNADVNIRSVNGATPLHVAAARGFEKIAERLIEAGADVDAASTPSRNMKYYSDIFCQYRSLGISISRTGDYSYILMADEDFTPLHTAVMGNHVNMVKFLLEHGANIDAETSQGKSALKIVAICGNPSLSIIDVLLSYSPNVKAANDQRVLSCLIKHAPKTNRVIVDKLLEYGLAFDFKDPMNYWLLFESVRCNRIEMVDIFLENGADINKIYFKEIADRIVGKPPAPTVLHLALRQNNTDMIKFTIDHGANVNVKPNNTLSPIFYAIENQNLVATQLLIANGACIKDDAKILIAAVEKNCFEIVENLILNGADVNKVAEFNSESFNPSGYKPLKQENFCNTKTALFVAAEKGHNKIVELLLRHGAKVGFKTNNDLDPLLVAVINGHLEVVEVLLNAGATVESTDAYKRKAFDLAVEFGHKDIVRLVFEYVARVDYSDELYGAPLAFSCKRGHIEIVDLLLKLGVNPDYGGNCHVQLNPPLFVAAEFAQYEVLKLLLDRGADTKYLCNSVDGWTPLRISAANGHLKCVDLLLKYGVDVDGTNRMGMSALHLATKGGHAQVVELLLDSDAQINFKAEDGREALSFAAENGHASVVEILLKRGANPLSLDSLNNTALYDASLNGHHETVKLLLEFCTKANTAHKCNGSDSLLHASTLDDYTPTVVADLNRGIFASACSAAAEMGHSAVVELLLSHGASLDPEAGNDLPFFLQFTKNGSSKIVETFLKHGANVGFKDKEGNTALHFAAEHGHLRTVELLLAYGAEVDAKTKVGKTPFLLSAARGHLNVVQVLLKNGANLESADCFNKTAVYYAAEFGHTEVVTFLLESGANVNFEASGKTPLLISAENGHVKIVEVLLRFNAQIDSKDKNGCTALHFSLKRGHIKMVELFLKNDAKCNCKTRSGTPAILIAAKSGCLQTVEVLLRYDAEIDSKDSSGFTALHLAAKRGHVEMVELLLENGANIDCETRDGIPPILFAAESGSLETVKILLKFGAFVDVFCRPGLRKYLLANVYKWKQQILKSILAYGSGDSKGLSESNMCALFDFFTKSNFNYIYNNDKPFMRYYFDLADSLLWHTLAMKTAKLYVGEEYIKFNRRNDLLKDRELSNTQEACEEHLEKIQLEYVGGTNVSLFNIFTASPNQLTSFAKDTRIVASFKSPAPFRKFYSYFNIIDAQFRKGEMRKKLLDEAVEICSILFGEFFLGQDPSDIIERIVSLLNFKELRILVHSRERRKFISCTSQRHK